MDEQTLLNELIRRGKPVNFRLLEARDIFAVPVAFDAESIIVEGNQPGEYALLYKRAISVITPSGGTNDDAEGIP